MKIRILLLAASMLLQINVSKAQSTRHHFALNDFAIDSSVQYIHASTITRDGGMLVLAGNEYRGGISVSDYGFSLIRFDANGNKLWNTYIYGESSFSVNYKGIIELPDNGFAIIANTTFNGGGFILKTDASGNFVFMKKYTREILSYTLDDSDNGFLIVTNSGNTFSELIKTDATGNIVWSDSRNYSVDPDHYYKAKRLANGNYMAVGVAYSNPSISNGVGIITCYTSSGSILWSQGYAGPEWVTIFTNFTELSDGSILLSGNATTVGVSGSRAMMTKIDATGNVLWSKSSPSGLTISFYGYTFGDNALYAAGNYDLPNNVTLPVIAKMDTSAQLTWLHIYPEFNNTAGVAFGSGSEFTINQDQLGFNNIRSFCNTDTAVTASCFQYDTAFAMNTVSMQVSNTTSTPAVIVATPTDLIRSNSSNINFVKFDACLFTGIQDQTAINASLVSVYPNPAKEFFTVNIASTDQSKNLTVIFVNNLGQTIKQVSLRSGSTQIETADMHSGIYFYKIENNSTILKTGKIVIE